jgi:1-acyl-sn-glycerol-3-phosphate acyltransferase
MLSSFVCFIIISFARLVTGARAFGVDNLNDTTQSLYYANHSSNVDFVLLWASLPSALRKRTRPVAAKDYWEKTAIRRYLIHKVFNGILVDRTKSNPDANPLQSILEALNEGHSLIFFPEGRRSMDEGLLPFKSGLFHLGAAFPQLALVPAWIANLNRVMPKGSVFPLPLLCTVSFGSAIQWQENEPKADFLSRARQALLSLSSEEL